MSVKIEQVGEQVVLGEGPHWDHDQQALYYVSILENNIHKYVPATGTHTKTNLGGSVGFIIPVDRTKDQFLVGLARKFVVIQWDGQEGTEAKVVKELAEVDKDDPSTRLNDGKADPRGRVFAGTMGKESRPGDVDPEKGSLFSLERNGPAKKLCSNINISNGLTWDLKEKAFYYIDSLDKAIRRYDYDVETGNIENKKIIFDLPKNGVEGLPDGMTIDTEGNLWVAVFGGSCVIKVDPKTGKLLQKIPIPAKQVTSVTFGGPNLDVLYVTSANVALPEQKPQNGATYKVTGLGVKGLPNLPFKL